MSDAPSESPIETQTPEEQLARCRHNLRNKLSPAVMVADYLCHYHDPEVSHQAKMIMASLEATLDEIKEIQISQ